MVEEESFEPKLSRADRARLALEKFRQCKDCSPTTAENRHRLDEAVRLGTEFTIGRREVYSHWSIAEEILEIIAGSGNQEKTQYS